jgi:hypothetical protein
VFGNGFFFSGSDCSLVRLTEENFLPADTNIPKTCHVIKTLWILWERWAPAGNAPIGFSANLQIPPPPTHTHTHCSVCLNVAAYSKALVERNCHWTRMNGQKPWILDQQYLPRMNIWHKPLYSCSLNRECVLVFRSWLEIIATDDAQLRCELLIYNQYLLVGCNVGTLVQYREVVQISTVSDKWSVCLYQSIALTYLKCGNMDRCILKKIFTLLLRL